VKIARITNATNSAAAGPGKDGQVRDRAARRVVADQQAARALDQDQIRLEFLDGDGGGG
jgi:hypothetical protein